MRDDDIVTITPILMLAMMWMLIIIAFSAVAGTIRAVRHLQWTQRAVDSLELMNASLSLENRVLQAALDRSLET